MPLLAARCRRLAGCSNLQIEIALTGPASKIFPGAIAIVGCPQASDHSIDYPATRTLEIASPYRHEAAEALQRVIRGMEPSFYSTFAVSIAESLR